MRPVVSYDDIAYDEVASGSYDDPGQPPAKKQKKKHRKPKPQSRELTQAEIWDDAALIDAWNAANEEYEAYHGPGKGWKDEPSVKSSLWYDAPPSVDAPDEDDEEDSKPLDFDTFVPTHDPSLDLPTFDHPPSVPGPDYSSYYLPTPPGPMVSRDEAFNRALGAMYWGGYWTAMYHCAVQNSEERVNVDEADEEASSDEEELVSTQRDL